MRRDVCSLEHEHPRNTVKFVAAVVGWKCDRCKGERADPADQATFDRKCAEVEPEYDPQPGRCHGGNRVFITVVTIPI